MKPSYSFDLDKAVAAWRRFHEQRRVFTREDLDELENHLREHVRLCGTRGVRDEEAFRSALQVLGDLDAGEDEYSKIYWRKLKTRHQIMDELFWRVSMLKNYLVIAFRNFKLYRGYSFINVFGLAVGVASCLFLLLFVADELSYDRFHTDAGSIYRVNQFTSELGSEIAVTPTIVAPLFRREFPEIREVTRLEPHSALVQVGTRTFDEKAFYFADSTFFRVFTHHFLAGRPETALNRPNTVVLTASMARKYFDQENPIGRTLRRNSDQEFEVTGVIEDLPSASHYRFDFLASFASRTQWANTETWGSANFYTFIRTQQGISQSLLQQKIDELVARLEKAGDQPRVLTLQPLTAIHLRSDVLFDLDTTGDLTYVYGFATIALLLLLISGINYINLATAHAGRRMKEVGLRKTLGAFRIQIVRQFFIESSLLTLMALLLAVGMVVAGLPWFNTLSGKMLGYGDLLAPKVGLFVLAVYVLVSMVAGSYPALYLSRFDPVRVLRGRLSAGRGVSRLRQGLVVLQFGISAVLIVGTLVVLYQLQYVSNRNLGFDKEHIVTLPLNDPVLREQFAAMENVLRQNPVVLDAGALAQIPGQLGWTSGFRAEGADESETSLIKGMPSDGQMVGALGLKIVAGMDFPRPMPVSDSTSVRYVLNEAAVRRQGWTPETAIGRRILINDQPGEVIGVTNDFNYRSLHESVEPLVIWYDTQFVNFLVVRLAPGDVRVSLSYVENVWKQFAPHRPFAYQFLDDVYDDLYRNEQQLGRVIAVFAFLAIFVACLGLFGLASFTAQQRSKEIGIRKVLGASVTGIVTLLSRDFLILVGVAFGLAVPVAWYVMNRWLDDFAYRIHLSVWIFLAAGAAALGIAFLTVSFQAMRSAVKDPVESLKYE